MNANPYAPVTVVVAAIGSVYWAVRIRLGRMEYGTVEWYSTEKHANEVAALVREALGLSA